MTGRRVIWALLLLPLLLAVELRLVEGSADAAPALAAGPEPTEELLAFGDAPFLGSTRSLDLRQPVVGMAPTLSGAGYWLVAADGGMFTFGDAPFLGSTGGSRLEAPIVGMAPTPSGRGYWLVASDGGIFAYGDAAFVGSAGGVGLHQPIVGLAPTATGRGYWLVASDGGIFAYGDASFRGSTGGVGLHRPIVGMGRSALGGYWLVASDGGIFAFGGAPFLGSTGGIRLDQPVVSMAPTVTGGGYWLVAADGGVFVFGDAPFLGGAGDIPLAGRAVAIAPRRGGRGYWLAVGRRTIALPGRPATWLLSDRTTGQALLEHRADAGQRPASTTKMLTALVAVRRLPPVATVRISNRAAAVPPTEAGARAGQVWSLVDALHGLLLPSGNDMAYAIAERVSGSVEAFGPEMQAVSRELGLTTSSTWRDPAGFDSATEAVGGGNFSTARDLARLGRALLDDPLLAGIVRTRTYTYRGSYGVPRTVTNSNRLLATDPTVFGVKTGTTSAAGQCLVTAARRGREVISVVLGADDRYAATAALLDRTPAA